MKSKNDTTDDGGAPVEIKPVSFRPAPEKNRFRSFRLVKWLLGLALGTFLILLCASAWFVFTARQVVIRIDPNPDHFSISGGIIAPKIGAYYLIRPGVYALEAFKKCYQPLQQNLPVTPITDLKVYRNDLVVSTMGRAFWIMDNLTPLNQLNDAATE